MEGRFSKSSPISPEVLENSCFQVFGDAESHFFLGGDFDGFARRRVTAHTCGGAFYHQDTETGNAYFCAAFDVFRDVRDQVAQNRFGSWCSWDRSFASCFSVTTSPVAAETNLAGFAAGAALAFAFAFAGAFLGAAFLGAAFAFAFAFALAIVLVPSQKFQSTVILELIFENAIIKMRRNTIKQGKTRIFRACLM